MANSTLVTVATTPLAADLSQVDRLVATLIHGCLFQEHTLITDAHLVNNPTLRVAIRRLPHLAEILDAGGCQIHRRKGVDTLGALHLHLQGAGAFHPGHNEEAFRDVEALNPFDELPSETWDPNAAGKYFAHSLIKTLLTSDADGILAVAIPDGDERRAAKALLVKVLERITHLNDGILRQRDVEQAMQSGKLPFVAELEAAWPGLFATIQEPFYEIERAMYDVAVPLSSGHALTFSQFHRTAARLAGRPRAFFQRKDNPHLVEISCEYLNQPNLLSITAKDMAEIRSDGGAYRTWAAAVETYKNIVEPSAADRAQLKTELQRYVRSLDALFENRIRQNRQRTIGQKLKLGLLGVAAKTGEVVEAAAAHATDPVVDIVLQFAGATGLDFKVSLGDSIEQVKKEIKSASAYADATAQLSPSLRIRL